MSNLWWARAILGILLVVAAAGCGAPDRQPAPLPHREQSTATIRLPKMGPVKKSERSREIKSSKYLGMTIKQVASKGSLGKHVQSEIGNPNRKWFLMNVRMDARDRVLGEYMILTFKSGTVVRHEWVERFIGDMHYRPMPAPEINQTGK